MCGRYLFWDAENPDIKALIDYAEEKLPSETAAKLSRSEAVPGSLCFSSVYHNNAMHTGIMKWGVKRNGRLVINARGETCLTSMFFYGFRPCVLPSCGYFEWDASKTKHLIKAENHKIMYLGGLYTMEEGQPVFVIVTQPASPSIEKIHDRQPLIFNHKHAKMWCRNASPSLYQYSLNQRIAIQI